MTTNRETEAPRQVNEQPIIDLVTSETMHTACSPWPCWPCNLTCRPDPCDPSKCQP